MTLTFGGEPPKIESPAMVATDNVAAPASHLFAVLDPARDPAIFQSMSALAQDARCLFGGALGSAVLQSAPHVMTLMPDGPLMRWWLAKGRGRAWGIVCRAGVSLDVLRLHLKTLLRARLPDGRLVLFRFWDPRVLETYLPEATAIEQARLFGPIQSIYTESGDGPRTWRRPTGLPTPGRVELEISPRAWEAFSAKDDERFIGHLCARVMREKDLSRCVTHETIKTTIVQLIKRAELFNFATEEDIEAFICAVLPVGEERLVETAGFLKAALTPDAPFARRAAWLAEASWDARSSAALADP